MQIAIVILIAVIAVGFVLYPLVRKGEAASVKFSDQQLNEQVTRYRESFKSDTLCGRCLAANPKGSKYCYDCGRPLTG